MRTLLPLHDVLASTIGGLATGLGVLRQTCGILKLRHPLRHGLTLAGTRSAEHRTRAYFRDFAAASGFQEISVETRLEPTRTPRHPTPPLSDGFVFPRMIRDIIIAAPNTPHDDTVRLVFTLAPRAQSIGVEGAGYLAREIESQTFLTPDELQALSGRWFNELTHLFGDLSCFSLGMQVAPPTAHGRLAATARLTNFRKRLH